MQLNEENIEKWGERYLNGEMTQKEIAELNRILKENPNLQREWKETLEILQLLNQQKEKKAFVNKLNDLKEKEAAHNRPVSKTRKVIQFFSQKNGLKIASMAAALLILTSVGTFLITEHSYNKNKNEQQYTRLRREIEHIKNSQNKILDSLNNMGNQEGPAYSGSGFALTNDGFIATNYHVVQGAQNIFIQSADKRIKKAEVFAFDSMADIAILKIKDPTFTFSSSDRLPYYLANKTSKLGERVYSLGFPQDNLVYNEGYISSGQGFQQDSLSYQVELPAYPGQSGAPVLDNSGKVIALITGKQNNTSSLTYAVHADALRDLIKTLPEHQQKELKLSTVRSDISKMSRVNQIETLRPYMCIVSVY